MKEIILSIKPCFSNEIYSGKKTIELRKSVGKNFINNNNIYIYSSSPVKAIDGMVKILKIEMLPITVIKDRYINLAKISSSDFDRYYEGHESGVIIWLKDVVKFKRSLPLHDLRPLGFTPPQSFSYVSTNIRTMLETLK